MAKKQPSSPKHCERCDAFYPSISSTTCPECFAYLTVLTDDEAKSLSANVAQRRQDEEYVRQKALDDEHFKEQSFGGCFALLGVMAIACLLAIIFLCTASKHKAAHHTPAGTIQQELPNADILPPTLGNLGRGQETMIAETGTPAQLLHCVYGTDIQVYAIPEKGITDKRLATFREIVRAVCVQTNPPLSNEEVHGKMAYYDIIGANGGLVGDTAERLNNLVGR